MTEKRITEPMVSLTVAARRARLSPARVREAIRIGLIRPYRVEGRAMYLSESDLGRLRRIRRLREDLGINTAGIEVVLRLLDEIEALNEALATSRRTKRTESGGARWPSA
jgi:MerR family transcriptional regulator/heat shock protein HspR